MCDYNDNSDCSCYRYFSNWNTSKYYDQTTNVRVLTSDNEYNYVSNWKSPKYDDPEVYPRQIVNDSWYPYIPGWQSNKYDDQNTNARRIVNRCLCVNNGYTQQRYRHRK